MSGLCFNFQIFKISHITFCNFFEAASKQGHLVLLIANSSLKKKKKALFLSLFFDHAGSSLPHGLFSSSSERGLLSSCGVWASLVAECRL